ncbi:MAG: hypothetical protein Q8K82_23840 [Gemmatimonadaceae bacterium]|nr:hypothetical protein [Gemmatimonadaceae bacterium]
MSDTIDRLSAALGRSYTIERELGAGVVLVLRNWIDYVEESDRSLDDCSHRGGTTP